MGNVTIPDLQSFIEENIQEFHKRRIDGLRRLKLIDVLKRKNPYLYKAKNIELAQELVRALLDAHLSSQEEAIFGNFLEKLAIFVCGKAYGGRKSSAEGIDLEFEKEGVLYIVSIKSGPNWGNSRQVKRMQDDFAKAKRVLRSSNRTLNIAAVNGCCYGREPVEDKGEYTKLCGQAFWELISGSDSLYIDIIEPLGHKAKEKNEEFHKQYAALANLLTEQFVKEFCSPRGEIVWARIVQLNSARL